MTPTQAHRLIGTQSRNVTRNMALALASHSWGNTADEWLRLEAAIIVLGTGAPKACKAVLVAHKANGARVALPNPFAA